MKKLAVILFATLPLTALAATDPMGPSEYVNVNSQGQVLIRYTNADVEQWKNLGLIHPDGSIDPLLTSSGGDHMAISPMPHLQPQLQPHQVPQQVVPTATPQATPQLQPQLTSQKTPQQVPQQVPTATPQTAPQLQPQLTSQKTPQQVPQQVPGKTPQATPQSTPQLSAQKTPSLTPHQVPTATPTAVPQAQPMVSSYMTPSLTSATDLHLRSLDNDVAHLKQDIAHNRDLVDKALDLSLSAYAVAELPQATEGRSSFGIGLSSAGGKTGQAIGYSSNFGDENEYTIKLNVSHAGDETAAGVGASYQW